MAAFINNDITAAGLLVLAKGVAGQQINYTKIVLGDGYLEEGQTPRSLTGVVSPKATIDITKCVVNGDGTVTVGGVFTNDQTNDGFYYRELGLYADDPDEDVGEVLYCYGNCGDLAEWIPPTGGARKAWPELPTAGIFSHGEHRQQLQLAIQSIPQDPLREAGQPHGHALPHGGHRAHGRPL